jgi:hypothetical protein
MFITKEQVIALAIKRTFSDGLLNNSDLVAAEQKYIKPILTDDLYDAVLASPVTYEVDKVDTSGMLTAYTTGLTANSVAITGISLADPAVFTKATHGFLTGQEILIEGTLSDDWDALLSGKYFVCEKIDASTFRLLKTLVSEYIKPALAYYIKYDIFNELFVEFSERGVYNLEAKNAQIISNQTRNEARNDVYNKAQTLSRILKEYIELQVENAVAIYQDYYDSAETDSVHSDLVTWGGKAKRANHF